MSKNLIRTVTFLVVTAFSTAALACQGNRVLLEDRFEDDAGGWYMDESIRIANSSFVMNIEPDRFLASLNPLFSLKDADICVEAGWPSDGRAQVGLMFWAEDYANFFMLSIRNDGNVALFRRQNRKWLSITAFTPSSAVKTSRGDTNVLRVKILGNQVSAFVNDIKIRDLRAPTVPEGWKMGLYSETYEQSRTIEVGFKKVKVTN